MKRPGCTRATAAQATIEFALALPLFLLVVFALIDFSRLLFTYVSLTDGTREMVRTATISRSSNVATIASFNNYTLVAGSENPATDQIVITVADESCVSDQRLGHACAAASLTAVTCSLPLQASCAIPARTSAGGGYIQVDTTYRFVFSPLFQNNLANIGEVWFMRPFSVLTTSARAYME